MRDRPAAVFDARALPCVGKHALIFRRWAQLGVGDSFVLLNDHRPDPLRRQFDHFVPGCCAWREIPAPPGSFAVRLTRLRADPADFDAARAGGCGPAVRAGENDLLVSLQLDYRDLPAGLARVRLSLLACGLPEGVSLQAALRAPDPELDRALSAAGLLFRGNPLEPAGSGWRYLIRHPGPA